jgi:hypothetical protein
MEGLEPQHLGLSHPVKLHGGDPKENIEIQNTHNRPSTLRNSPYNETNVETLAKILSLRN